MCDLLAVFPLPWQLPKPCVEMWSHNLKAAWTPEPQHRGEPPESHLDSHGTETSPRCGQPLRVGGGLRLQRDLSCADRGRGCRSCWGSVALLHSILICWHWQSSLFLHEDLSVFTRLFPSPPWHTAGTRFPASLAVRCSYVTEFRPSKGGPSHPLGLVDLPQAEEPEADSSLGRPSHRTEETQGPPHVWRLNVCHGPRRCSSCLSEHRLSLTHCRKAHKIPEFNPRPGNFHMPRV